MNITLRQAQQLVAFFGGHDCEVTITEQSQDGAGGTPGLYAHCTEYHEEGAEYLGPTEVAEALAAPAALPAGDVASPAQPVVDVVILSGKTASCREREGHGLPDGPHALYAAPAALPAVQPLTDEQIDEIANDGCRNAAGGIYATRVYEFARAIERALAAKEQPARL